MNTYWAFKRRLADLFVICLAILAIHSDCRADLVVADQESPDVNICNTANGVSRIDGEYSPGNSPGIITFTNVAFGTNAALTFELGGTTPGSGTSNHDQVNDNGTITMGSNTTLQVVPFNNYVPADGDQFVVMTWQTELTEEFPNVIIDSFYSTNGVTLTSTYSNLIGMGNLTLTATAVPEASAWLCLSFIAICIGAVRFARRFC